MKKIMPALLFLFFAVISHADERNMYEMYKDDPDIKVYLADVKSDIPDPEVNIEEFKTIFADVHRKRLNMKFTPVTDAKEADVIVTAKIKEYKYTKRTLPSIFGVAALAADTATPKSSAKLVVDYTIINPKDNTVLSEYKNFATDDRRPVPHMTAKNAFEFAASKNINKFIFAAFHKQRPPAHAVAQ